MVQDNTVYNILLDLDTLLDTRLPIYYALSTEVASDMLSKDLYHRRIEEGYGVVTKDIFDIFYRQRDKNVLEFATPTTMLDLLGSYCVRTEELMEVTDSREPLTVYLNVYPYDLNLDEQEAFITMLKVKIPIDINVKVVSMSNKELTPEWVVDNLNTVIKYDALEWLNLQIATSEIFKSPLLSVNLIGPSIVKGVVIKNGLTNVELFQNLMSSAGSLISLILVKNEYFNSVK